MSPKTEWIYLNWDHIFTSRQTMFYVCIENNYRMIELLANKDQILKGEI
jgi:hypothetical protein